MLQVYSSNLDVVENAVFSFNNVVVDKGCAEALSAPASIQLNQRGIYLVEVDGFATSATAETDVIQLVANGVALPQAVSNITFAANSTVAFGFKTFVQVANNNCPCNCTSSPTVLQVLNGDTALTDAHINVVVTKLR